MAYSLVGINGNAFCVMGYVLRAMKECKMTKKQQEDYQKAAMSSDYNNLLCKSMEVIDKCNSIVGDDSDEDFDEDDE